MLWSLGGMLFREDIAETGKVSIEVLNPLAYTFK